MAWAAERIPDYVVPFVGCASDGQTGPLPAPTGSFKDVHLFLPAVTQLAFYKSEFGPGVLGPKGWHCIGLYGSNGSILIVTPDPISADDFLGVRPKGISGPAIQAGISIGDTSGRFEVAAMIARYFPVRMAFVRDVIMEGIMPAVDFPSGPFANDVLISRGDNVVEYQTPAHAEGLGTVSRFVPDENPIRTSVVLLGQTPDMLQLSVRLPRGMDSLAIPIMEQAEKDALEE